MRFRREMAAAGALASLGGAPQSARANESGLPVALTYQADAACPDQASFFARIDSRTPLRASRGEASALRLDVALRSNGSGFRGQLRTDTAEGSETRLVEAATCNDVADALALMGALLAERTKRQDEELLITRESPAPPPTKTVIVRPSPQPQAIALGAEGFITWPVTSTRLVGTSISLFVDGQMTWWLSTGYARNDLLDATRRLRLGYGAVTLGVGPRSFVLAPRVELAAGVGAEGGFLTAEGAEVDVPISVRRSYWALGLLARLEWRALEQGYLVLHGTGFVPLVERAFSTREPYERVGTTAIVVPKVGVGIALAF